MIQHLTDQHNAVVLTCCEYCGEYVPCRMVNDGLSNRRLVCEEKSCVDQWDAEFAAARRDVVSAQPKDAA